MGKFLSIIFVLIIIGATADACDGSGSDDAAPPSSYSATDTSAGSASNDDVAFVAVLRSMSIIQDSVPDSMAVQLGHEVCSAKQSGVSDRALADTITSSGVVGYGQAGVVIGAAESAYCPDQSSNI